MPRARKRPDAFQLSETCRHWNASYPVGTTVDFINHPGDEPVRTTTTSEAYVMGGHTACIFLAGVSGCVDLDHCTRAS